MGKKLKFPDPEQILDRWAEYKKHCDEDYFHNVASAGKVVKVPYRKIYGLSSFVMYLGITRETWSKYKARLKYADTIKRIEDEVFARKEDAMVNQEGSVAGLIFDMKANYKLSDKQELDVNLAATITQVAPKVIGTGVPLASNEKDIAE